MGGESWNSWLSSRFFSKKEERVENVLLKNAQQKEEEERKSFFQLFFFFQRNDSQYENFYSHETLGIFFCFCFFSFFFFFDSESQCRNRLFVCFGEGNRRTENPQWAFLLCGKWKMDLRKFIGQWRYFTNKIYSSDIKIIKGKDISLAEFCGFVIWTAGTKWDAR